MSFKIFFAGFLGNGKKHEKRRLSTLKFLKN